MDGYNMACIKQYKRPMFFDPTLRQTEIEIDPFDAFAGEGFYYKQGEHLGVKDKCKKEDKSDDSKYHDEFAGIKVTEEDTKAQKQCAKNVETKCWKNETSCAQQAVKSCIEYGKAINSMLRKADSLCSNGGVYQMNCRRAILRGKVVANDWYLGPSTDIDGLADRCTPKVARTGYQCSDQKLFYDGFLDWQYYYYQQLDGCHDGSSIFWEWHPELNPDFRGNRKRCELVIKRDYGKKADEQRKKAEDDCVEKSTSSSTVSSGNKPQQNQDGECGNVLNDYRPDESDVSFEGTEEDFNNIFGE